ncbi:hypothetical protein VNO80_28761 [Phaseolus coccineus]|uniref:Uncharacterized protein n=1 Tax=Phaseolus coccineus TaxID=3886 RepID=A0AAN9QBS5_PHACN
MQKISVLDTCSKVLEESLQKLGVEKLNKDDVQKLEWEVLEAKIGNWIHFMLIAVATTEGACCVNLRRVWKIAEPQSILSLSRELEAADCSVGDQMVGLFCFKKLIVALGLGCLWDSAGCKWLGFLLCELGQYPSPLIDNYGLEFQLTF